MEFEETIEIPLQVDDLKHYDVDSNILPISDIKSNKPHRFIALIFICILPFGAIVAGDLNLLSPIMNDFVFNSYLWPNIVTPLICGVIMDRYIKLKSMTIVCAALLIIGHIILSTAGYFNATIFMMFGRFLSGVGGESLKVAQFLYAVSWFKGREMNMAFGLVISLLQSEFLIFDKFVTFYFKLDNYYEYYSIATILSITGILCLVSLISAMILRRIDTKSKEELNRELSGMKKFRKLKEFIPTKPEFWMIFIICFVQKTFIYRFYKHNRLNSWEDHDEHKENLIITVVTVILLPIIGFTFDKIGKNITCLFSSILTVLLGHIILNSYQGILGIHFEPFIGLILTAVGYSIFLVCLFSIIVVIVPKHQLGTSFGLCLSVENIFTVLEYCFERYMRNKLTYLITKELLGYCVAAALIIAGILWIYNWKTKGILNMKKSEREYWLEQNAIKSSR